MFSATLYLVWGLCALYVAVKATKFYRWLRLWSHPVTLYGHEKTAVVTGCTDGVGLAIARVLRDSGYRLVLISRSQEKLDSIGREFPNSVKVLCDYEKRIDEQNIYQTVIQENVTVFINNAGISHPNLEFRDIKQSDIEKVFRVNVLSTMAVSRVVMRAMNRGIVANISSGSSLFAAPYMSVYAASKAALDHWIWSVKVENSYPGLKFQTFSPYYISTKLSEIPESVTVPSAETWAKSAMGQLGRSDTTGYLIHDMMQWFLSCMSKRQGEAYMREVNGLRL